MGTKQTSKKIPVAPKKHKTFRRWALIIVGCIVALIVATYIVFQISPWPSALVIRHIFEQGSKQTSAALQKYVPNNVDAILNQSYRANDPDATLNVFYPQSAAASTAGLPTVVWIHGGAWISGNKDDMTNYLKILAARGFTTVSVNYSIAPEKHYPTPIIQTNAALGYLQQHATALHIDPTRIVLAGDSAGSQIAAQLAAITTSPTYAKQVGVMPGMPANHLKASVLNCGAYDLALVNYKDPKFGGFLKTVLWAYSGKRDFLHDSTLQYASVANYVTSAFPPTFITAGNADPLEQQSTEFAQRLTAANVPVQTLFYPSNHQPALPHEYQFNLDTADGKASFEHIVSFVQSRMQ
jgi:acetyl esterase/lipase